MRVFALILAILTLTAGLASLASAVERTPAGSYLVYRAATVGELRAQVEKNPIVRSRFSRHFGVSPAELDKYFAAELELTALKQPLRTRCWYVNRAGGTSVKTKLLPRGTMVFATKSGEPILSWSCGNPLSSALPRKVVKASVESQTKPVEIKVLANPVETISNAVVTAPPAPSVVSVIPVETPPVLATVAAPAVSMPPIIAAAGSIGLGWVGAVGAVGGLTAGLSSGGRKSRITVVPEPSGLAALATAVCLIPAMCRVRRRRS